MRWTNEQIDQVRAVLCLRFFLQDSPRIVQDAKRHSFFTYVSMARGVLVLPAHHICGESRFYNRSAAVYSHDATYDNTYVVASVIRCTHRDPRFRRRYLSANKKKILKPVAPIKVAPTLRRLLGLSVRRGYRTIWPWEEVIYGR